MTDDPARSDSTDQVTDIRCFDAADVHGGITILIIILSFVNLAAISVVERRYRIINNSARASYVWNCNKANVQEFAKNRIKFMYNIKSFKIIKRTREKGYHSFHGSSV